MTPRSLIEPARHAGAALLRSQTDARLVDLTRDGNERAFEAIVQRYRGALLRYCTRFLSAARAEDAVQQAFLSAHHAIHAGDGALNLRPWLYRIAHNAALNQLRQSGFDHEPVSEEIDGVETPVQAFERGERLRMVIAAVRDLPERQRDAVVLQAFEGRSYDEIATQLGVSDGAVRQLLNRARNTLREAAAAVTPTGLLSRAAADGGDVGAALTGAGGSALILKAGAALVVAGAVAGGVVSGGLPGAHRHHAHPTSQRVTAAQSGTTVHDRLAADHVAGSSSPAALRRPHDEGALVALSGGSYARTRQPHRAGVPSRSGSPSKSPSPAPTGVQSPGAGRSGSGDRHSGSDGRERQPDSGSSGSSGSGASSGSGPSSSGSSDGGSSGSDGGRGSGSGSSGSGDSGSGSSGSGSSGSGSSGSGDSGSGRDGSVHGD